MTDQRHRNSKSYSLYQRIHPESTSTDINIINILVNWLTALTPHPLQRQMMIRSPRRRHRRRATATTWRFRTTLTHPPPLHEPTQPTLLQTNNATQVTGPNFTLRTQLSVRITTVVRAGRGPALAVADEFRVGLAEASAGCGRGGAGVAGGIAPAAVVTAWLGQVCVDAECWEASGWVGEVVGAARG